MITPSVSDESMIELNNSKLTVPTKRKEPFSNPTRLWYMRIGHINLNRINRLVKEGILGDFVIPSIFQLYELTSVYMYTPL